MAALELTAGTLPAADKPNLVAFLADPPTLPLTSHAPQFGLASLIRHRVEGGSYALPLAGLVLSAIAILEWGVATYAVLWSVESMRW